MMRPMVKPAVLAAGTLAAVALSLSGCSPDQPASTTPGTTPPVWTGSTAPSTAGGHGGHGGEQPIPSGEKLNATLKLADGTPVAKAEFVFQDGFATITVKTTENGKLTPGFHGLHIHSFKKCEANSTAPAGGTPGDFLSAGGHFNVPGYTGHPSSGDLVSINILKDGSGELVTTADSFTKDDLTAGNGTSIIIHEKADNFANVPPERYTQANGTAGPDDTTKSTGDAGKRVACGLIDAG
ncbi:MULTISPECIES: superoxide dismutase[Cu-Zn] [Mycobacteroides]|jgi:Cu-Zn family superoxide dismutase|uniref:Superoxide dismutase [Cu-Zn] n=1 Tax=Mycobacteroides chelonae TaxID=1774 RepID=A0A1S1KEX2_MYCCH|nr:MULTISPECIES: superoxide dismutase family protein [Mycobacteroides]SKN90768.1 Superoxide dismutase [Cu-Zn] precursor [Mycobacteroides abscessus subsp. bolletii]KRQ18779.1 superoxide dismutase [Mycobacteroides sp. H003]KRQ28494.1 superoxide dismutase [Mycobacteroides sp. H072]KRQ30455.1 superoxide dismutase [Mycobacteroides sp. H092]KRQ36437.1 superoxide dismutase [Mycobacteroides sp. H101]